MKQLLVVDDDQFAIKMLMDLFGKEWKILAETVKERIPQRFATDPPDVVILNVGLRRTDGEPTFDVIRQTMPETPVIVCSPSNMLKTGRELLRKGAFWNLITPLNTLDLEHVMKIAMEVKDYKRRALETQKDFVQLEEGIARLSLPSQDIPEQQFSFEQDEMTQGIVDLLADILQVERVSLMLLDHANGELRIKAAKGLHPTVIRNTVKRLGEGIAGSVARDGKPLFIRNVERDAKHSESPYYDQFTTKSLICVPLKAGDRVVGVLNANNKRSGASFEEHELYLMTIFSHILLMALQSAQAHFEKERALIRDAQLGKLYRKLSGNTDLPTLLLNLLSECTEIFQADGGIFVLQDEKESAVTAYAVIGDQITETELPPHLMKLWQSTRSSPLIWNHSDFPKNVLMAGVVKDAETWISVPVTLQNKRIGSLELGSVNSNRFQPSDLQRLSQLGQHAALGIQNTRLYQKLLASIQEISEARKEVDRVRRNQFL